MYIYLSGSLDKSLSLIVCTLQLVRKLITGIEAEALNTKILQSKQEVRRLVRCKLELSECIQLFAILEGPFRISFQHLRCIVFICFTSSTISSLLIIWDRNKSQRDVAASRNAVSVIGTLRLANHQDFFHIRFASVPKLLHDFLFLSQLLTPLLYGPLMPFCLHYFFTSMFSLLVLVYHSLHLSLL